jgi:hypothetical protein
MSGDHQDSHGRKGACCPARADGHPAQGGIGNDCSPPGHRGDGDGDHGNGGQGNDDQSVTIHARTIGATSPTRGSGFGELAIGGALMLAGLVAAGMLVRRRLRVW